MRSQPKFSPSSVRLVIVLQLFQNILLTKSGMIKLADFGVSKFLVRSTTISYKGTEKYMAPEILAQNTRTKTPWHLNDGHGNSTEPTGSHGWSTPGNRWEKFEAGYSESHQWPPVQIDIFRNVNLAYGTFKFRKKSKKFCMQFSWKFCYNIFRKSIYAIKRTEFHQYWRYGCQLSFKWRSRLERRR